jgi:hypothetical protein
MSGTTLVVGADLAGAAAGAPGVIRYTRTGSAWGNEVALRATGARAAGGFGASVALDGDLLLVGAPDDDGAGANTGAVCCVRPQRRRVDAAGSSPPRPGG